MKRLALLSSLCFASFGTTSVFADSRASPITALAPADRTFGEMKISVLGIRNAIKDISRCTDVAADVAAKEDVRSLFHKLTLVENALVDLKTKFPNDTWIPQLGLGLAQAFLKMHIADAAVRANDAIDWVIADYPLTDQAVYAKALRRASFAVGPAIDPVPIDSTITLPSHRP